MSLRFYLRYALRSLRRDSRRTLLGTLCIAFGVLSLVSMQLLSGMVADVMDVDPRLELNGDALLLRSGSFFSDADLAQLERWKQEGLIADYAPRATRWATLLKPPGTGRIHFLGQAYGIEPEAHFLVRELPLRDPVGATAADVLRAEGDAILTRDVADDLNLQVGDTFALDSNGAPVSLRLAGVAQSTPTGLGDTAFYNMDTARLLSQRANPVNEVSILWGEQGAAVERVEAAGWFARTPEQVLASRGVAKFFTLMLRGAGILGLIVGGIGVANTMQVLLARRTLEIATLKTHGYRQRDLLALFGIETALMGLLGGALGSLAALAVSRQLFVLLTNTGSLLVEGSPDVGYALGGLLVGVVAAAIFGLQAIVASSAVRPITLLRDLPSKQSRRTKLTSTALYAVLVLLFSGLSSVVMGSPLRGVATVIGGAILLGGIGAAFWLVLGAALRVPLPPLPLLTLARNNLKQRPRGAVVALIALFAGIFSISFAATTMLAARNEVQGRRASEVGYNLVVYGSAAEEARVRQAATEQGATQVYTQLQVPVQVQPAANPEGAPRFATLTWADGRTEADLFADLRVATGVWEHEDDAALLPLRYQGEPWSVELADVLRVSSARGEPQWLRVTGFYTPLELSNLGHLPTDLIITREAAEVLGGSRAVILAQVPPPSQRAVVAALGATFPETMVYSQADQNDLFTRAYQTLFLFVVAVAGLALVEGAILIANSVSLAIVERRREIGILKAVGYTSRRVLGTLLIEYALLGLLAGILGTGAVAVAVVAINLLQPGLGMTMNPALVIGMSLLSVALALASAAAVAWHPTQVRPLDVLRNE